MRNHCPKGTDGTTAGASLGLDGDWRSSQDKICHLWTSLTAVPVTQRGANRESPFPSLHPVLVDLKIEVLASI